MHHVNQSLANIKSVAVTWPKKHIVAESAWSLWLRQRGWMEVPSWSGTESTSVYFETVGDLLCNNVTADAMLDTFCEDNRVASSLLEGSPYMRQKLVAELAGLIDQATAAAGEILCLDGPGYAKGDSRFNGVGSVKYPWMAAEEDPLGMTRLTILYERSLDFGGFEESDKELVNGEDV